MRPLITAEEMRKLQSEYDNSKTELESIMYELERNKDTDNHSILRIVRGETTRKNVVSKLRDLGYDVSVVSKSQSLIQVTW